jgi:uncharacterized protein (DUF58 family)
MKTTREGKRFILATVLIGVAAVNTGNNLIYLIFSLMLSFILLAIALLLTNLSGISLEVSLNHPVFAGERSQALFTLRNRKKRIPAYSIHITAPGVSSPVYCAFVPTKGLVKEELKITFSKRGMYSFGDFFIRSGFPFILFEKNAAVKVSGGALVYPALIDVDQVISDISGREGLGTKLAIGASQEIHAIREFRYGDDWRNIHWKATAKASSLMVKEYAVTEIRKVTLIIDNLLPEEEADFEKILSLAGSLAHYFLGAGYFVRVLSCKKVVPFGAGDEHLFKTLDVLALMHEEDSMDCPMSHDVEGYTILLLKSGSSAFNRYIAAADVVMYAGPL